MATHASDRPTPFAVAVHAVVSNTEAGECLSYGDVAREAGFPGAARGVGRVLAHSDGLPWWRIIRADGTLPKGEDQACRLEAEGVAIRRIGAGPRVTG